MGQCGRVRKVSNWGGKRREFTGETKEEMMLEVPDAAEMINGV